MMEQIEADYLRHKLRLQTILYINSAVCGHLIVILATVLLLLQHGVNMRLGLASIVGALVASWIGSGALSAGKEWAQRAFFIAVACTVCAYVELLLR